VPFRSIARTPVQRENINSSIVLCAVLRLAPLGNKTRETYTVFKNAIYYVSYWKDTQRFYARGIFRDDSRSSRDEATWYRKVFTYIINFYQTVIRTILRHISPCGFLVSIIFQDPFSLLYSRHAKNLLISAR